MRHIPLLIVIVLTILTSCTRKPYWQTQALGCINSLRAGDTLYVEDYTEESFYTGLAKIKFFVNNDTLYVSHTNSRLYYNLIHNGYDTLLFCNVPSINISENSEILGAYKKFENAIKGWNDSTSTCSSTSKYGIYFNRDSLTITDMSCKFNYFNALSQEIVDNVVNEELYLLTMKQMDSVYYNHVLSLNDRAMIDSIGKRLDK